MQNISRPYLHKDKWLIFPDTTYTKLDILDCDDTTHGLCVEDITLDQCIDKCEKFNKYCSFGYYVKTNKGKTLCAPLRTELYPNLNPVSILSHKNIYPEFVEADVSTFMNSKVHPFPRNQANTVFYKDIMNLINTETNMSIDSDTEELRDGSSILFTPLTGNDRLNITFFPIDKNILNVAPHVPVMYGDKININVANSALVMKKEDTTENIIWSQSLGTTTEDFAFRILPVFRGKIGEPVAYGDKVMFTYATDGFYVVVDSGVGNVLSLHSGDYDRILSIGNYYPTFTLESRMVAYYCDTGMCKSVPMVKLNTDGLTATYKGSMTTRLRNCMGICSYSPDGRFSLSSLSFDSPKSEKSDSKKYIIFIVVIFIILVILLTGIYHARR